MECFVSFGILVVIIVVTVGLASKAQAHADGWNRAIQTVAKRYGGSCIPAGWFSHPSVRFHYGSTQALLNTYNAGRGGQFTQIQIQWPDPDFRLEVFPNLGGIRYKPFRGMYAIEIGAKEFDVLYSVRTDNETEARAFLTDGVRWQIDRLFHLLGSGDVYLAIHRGRLMIKKPSYIRRTADLEEFTQLSLELYDQAMLTRMVGIAFVQDDNVQVIKEAVCQICGDDITTDMVFCRRCKTPHHQECWQYYGSCAVYGCQEQRFVVPKLAGPSTES